MPRSVNAQLRPLLPGETKTLGDLLASLPRLTPEEADRFAEDLGNIRTKLNGLPARDHWEV